MELRWGEQNRDLKRILFNLIRKLIFINFLPRPSARLAITSNKALFPLPLDPKIAMTSPLCRVKLTPLSTSADVPSPPKQPPPSTCNAYKKLITWAWGKCFDHNINKRQVREWAANPNWEMCWARVEMIFERERMLSQLNNWENFIDYFLIIKNYFKLSQ